MALRKLLVVSLLLSLSTAASADVVLEELIVTATKRSESTQDIALSIETVSGETMEAMGITDFAELQSTVPNLNVGGGITSNSVVIRGLGSGQERSFEQSVGMFIDGMYMPRNRMYLSPFFDVARVEVARGPQSVVHGLNSTAGAISIVTNRTQPGDPFFADIMIDTETEYGGESAQLVLGGSLGERLGLRAAIKTSDRDGYYENSFTGEDEGDLEDELFRISAVWNISDSAALTVKYESAERTLDGNVGEMFDFAGGLVTEPNDNRLNYVRSSNGCHNDTSGFPAPMTVPGINPDTCPTQTTDLETILANLEIQLENHVLTAMVGHSEFDFDFTVDLDTNSDAFIDASIDEGFESDAIEIRLTSSKGNKIDYMVGVYYHDYNTTNDQPAQYGPALFGGLLSSFGPFGADLLIHTSNLFDQSSELRSVFGQATFNVSESVSVTAGLRYTDEDKDSKYDTECALGYIATQTIVDTPLPGTLGLCSTNPAAVGLEVDRSSDNLLPELAVHWEINDNAMVYFKGGRSAKSGGFTSSMRNPPTTWSPADQEYDDETTTGFEIGLKSRWMDNRLELNAALYDTEFDDLQVNTFTPVGGVIVQNVTNAATATSTGLELDLRYAATENLEFGGSWAFQNAEYDSFKNGTCNITSGLTSPCDQSGKTLHLAPDWSGHLYADLVMPVTGTINFVANLSVSLSDEYYTDGALEPAGKQDSWTKVDARLGIQAADGRWSLAVVGRNLGDERVLSQSQSFFNSFLVPTYLGYLEPPRTIMVQARFRFGGE